MGDAFTVCSQATRALVGGLETRLFSDATQPPILRRIDGSGRVVQERLAVTTTVHQLLRLVWAVARRSGGFESRVLDGDAKLRVYRKWSYRFV